MITIKSTVLHTLRPPPPPPPSHTTMTEIFKYNFDYFDKFAEAFHKLPMEIDLTQACVGELNTILRGETNWPIIYGVGINIKTGEIFPASFPDKGPDLQLRQARNFAGGQTVWFRLNLNVFCIFYSILFCFWFYMCLTGARYLWFNKWNASYWTIQLRSHTWCWSLAGPIWWIFVKTFVNKSRSWATAFYEPGNCFLLILIVGPIQLTVLRFNSFVYDMFQEDRFQRVDEFFYCYFEYWQ